MHLLPRNSPQDSLAKDAFSRVYENTSGSAPALYHLVEFAVLDEDLRRASELLARYRAASPDTTGYAVSKLDLMLHCAASGAEAIDWREEVLEDANTVGQAARSLGVGGAFPGCALSAWHAIRTFAPSDNAWQFAAWTGLHGLFASTGRTTELAALIDTTSQYGTTPRLQSIISALGGADVHDLADSVANEMRKDIFALNEWRLWFLGVWEAYRGRVDEARAIRDTLAARAARTGDRSTSLVARSMSAHVALADGDTTLALQRFINLTPTGSRELLQRPWESLGLERLMLARLLLARGEYAEAQKVAATFDSPGATNIINTVFLPASLEIRLHAAQALENQAAVRSIESRQSVLRRR
jgi:hypothetical protein